ncbi:uncharacterized protein CLAFUR5_02451 [Fulvia fulva]|uniref:Uncharacterized protein n=1 Tax=Passalora fulva TaxID=5499 RepID=A0A9Q8P578_PASFU|nr:uncharacterized protein CLAFUR5_02451 [Fulvia fulva]UJO13723.1 hypothetical protein CLAFUR5_02451 [Fulvia fulva]
MMFGQDTVMKCFSGSGLKDSAAELPKTDSVARSIDTTHSTTETPSTQEDIHTPHAIPPSPSSPASSHTLSAGSSDHDGHDRTAAPKSGPSSIKPIHINGTITHDYAILEFSYYMSPGMKKRNQAWETQEVAVLLDARVDDLREVCADECRATRRRNHGFMLELKGEGEGVHMKASIEFYDERDLYANPNGEGRYRVERVRDLFTADEVELENSPTPFEIPIAVEVALLSESHPMTLSRPSQYTYLRLGGRKLADPHASPHQALVEGLYLRHGHDPLRSPAYLWAPERVINGVKIGSLAVPVLPGGEPGKEELEVMDPVLRTEVLRDMRNPRMSPSVGVAKKMEKSMTTGTVPVLPSMTFTTHNPPATIINDSSPTYLAIRLLNHLQTLDLAHIPLPSNLLMTLTGPSHGKKMLNAMTSALSDYLPSTAPELFKSGAHWDIRWWVLPQVSSGGEGKVGKLCRFEGGSIERFLDVGMVERGRREVYVC